MSFDINVTFHADDRLLTALDLVVPYLQMLTQKASTTRSSAPIIPEPEAVVPTAPTAGASPVPTPAPAVAAPVAPVTPAVPAPPTGAPQTPAVPVAPTAPAPIPVTAAPTPSAPVAPTSPAPGYTLEQLSKAGAGLASDPIKRDQLIALLQQFGVPAITMLPPEQYGAFATALRGLGAKI